MKTMTPEQEKELEQAALVKLMEVTRMLKSVGVQLRCEGGNVDIARIGHWVWAEGEELKEKADIRGMLKGAGFKFSPIRKAWGWSPYKFKGKRSKLALEQLAQKYGYELAR